MPRRNHAMQNPNANTENTDAQATISSNAQKKANGSRVAIVSAMRFATSPSMSASTIPNANQVKLFATLTFSRRVVPMANGKYPTRANRPKNAMPAQKHVI